MTPDDTDESTDPETGDASGETASSETASGETASGGLVVSERDTQEGLLVSVCDGELIGQTFEEGAVSLTVTEEFYGGDRLPEAEARERLSRAAVANVVGSRSVRLAIDAGYVEEENVLAVDGTHHAQFVRF